MKFKKANLHTHTICSDGILSPEDVIKKAASSNISAISFTDHDTLNGYKVFKPNDHYFGVELISGVEISSMLNNQEVHILGYFVDINNLKLLNFLREQAIKRENRLRNMIDTLQRLKISIHFDEVLKHARSTSSIGRPHLANTLLIKGYVSSFEEAFEKYIGIHCEAYKATDYASTEAAINLVQIAGGVSILAHPSKHIPRKLIFKLIKQGIDGIEIIHPSHSDDQVKFYTQIAFKNHLLVSGGSDFHGRSSRDNANFSKYLINYEWVQRMKKWINRSED